MPSEDGGSNKGWWDNLTLTAGLIALSSRTVRPMPAVGREQKESAWHEGASVLNGRKSVLRTDVMYLPPKETGDT